MNININIPKMPKADLEKLYEAQNIAITNKFLKQVQLPEFPANK